MSAILNPVFVLVNESKGLYGISKDYKEVQKLADWTDGNKGVFKTIWSDIENVSFDGITIDYPNDVAVQVNRGYLEF